MGTNWIKFSEKRPPINKKVLVWVSEDFQTFAIGTWNGDIHDFCSGWDTTDDLSKYREITHWMPLPKKPSSKKLLK